MRPWRHWDDPNFVRLDLYARYLLLYLTHGPEAAEGCPGIVLIGIGGIADALRASSTDTDAALRQLGARGWLQEDRPLRVLHVPTALEHRLPDGVPSSRALWSWFRRWRKVPDCELKYKTLATLHDVLPQKTFETKAWLSTFATVSVDNFASVPIPSTARQQPVNNRANPRTSGPQLPLIPENTVQMVDARISMDPEQELDPELDPELESDPEPGGPPLNGSAVVCHALWDRLQLRRTELDLPAMAAVPGNLATIHGLLAPAGPYRAEQLEHAVDACAYEAAQKPACEWLLNGIDTWSPKIIDRHVGMRRAPRDDHDRNLTAADLEKMADRLGQEGL